MPAQAGIQKPEAYIYEPWIPAFAGMTEGAGMTEWSVNIDNNVERPNVTDVQSCNKFVFG